MWESETQQPDIRHESMRHIIPGAVVAAGMRALSFAIMDQIIGGSGFRALPRPVFETARSHVRCAVRPDLARYRQAMTITRARAWHLLTALVCAASLSLQFYLSAANENTEPSAYGPGTT